MTIQASLILAAVLLIGTVIVLGAIVSRRPPNAFDKVAGTALRGYAPAIALMFTRSGRAWTLTSLGVVAFGVFLATKSNLLVPSVMVASQILSQGVAEILKRGFHRERPAQLLLHKSDIGFSYPSGHAVTAVVFFAGWGLIALDSTLPNWLRIAITAGLFIWALGIIWSRVALAAHYITDVLGGFMFGAAWVCALLAVVIELRGVSLR